MRARGRIGAGRDLVQFFIDFKGKTFAEACATAGRDVQPPARFNRLIARQKEMFTPSRYESPADLWQQKAEKFVDWAHQHLLANDEQLFFWKTGLFPGIVLGCHQFLTNSHVSGVNESSVKGADTAGLAAIIISGVFNLGFDPG